MELPSAMMLVFTTACAHSTSAVATKIAGPAATRPCAPEAALPDAVARPGAIVLLGEVHGTDELPRFAAEVACNASRTGAEVRVGLEVPRSEQQRLNSYMNSPRAASDRRALLAGDFWQRPAQDGRSSAAMLATIDRLAALGSRHDLGVFLFDPDSAAADRDQQMAAFILDEWRAHPQAVFVILAGNLHTRLRIGSPWDPEFKPMGVWLQARGAEVTSFNCDLPSGSAWICTGALPDTCGPRRVGAGKPPAVAGFDLFEQLSPPGYSGRYRVTSATASPPAIGRYRIDPPPRSFDAKRDRTFAPSSP